MEPLIRDPRLRKLSFTGSTEVGKRLVEQSAEQLLRVSMELGGNAPFLVFGDADLDAAVDGAMLAKMRNMGEACTAANRFIVHESVADEFARRLAERMGALRVGRGTRGRRGRRPAGRPRRRSARSASSCRTPSTPAPRCSPAASAVGERGYFYAPTVLNERPPAGAAAPRGGLRPGRADRHLLLRRGGGCGWRTTPSTASSRTPSPRTSSARCGSPRGWTPAWSASTPGIVSNPAAPFGGVKQSGFGREGGAEGIEEYLETKYVGIAL